MHRPARYHPHCSCPPLPGTKRSDSHTCNQNLMRPKLRVYCVEAECSYRQACLYLHHSRGVYHDEAKGASVEHDKIASRHLHSAPNLADDAVASTALSHLLDWELSDLVVLSQQVGRQISDQRAKVK